MIKVKHLTTGPPDQIGGIASVVRDSVTAGSSTDDLEITAHFVERDVFRHEALEPLNKVVKRVRGKINRLSTQDPFLHPYRYPALNHGRIDRDIITGADILHVHKPSLWRAAINLAQQPGGPALVFHAHSVDGFTGGCVLEQDCPQLAHGCQRCPIVKPALQLLPPRGLQVRAQQLAKGRPYIVANSEATLAAISRSGIIPDDVGRSVVYPAVSTEQFYTQPSSVSSDKKPTHRIGFISYSVENPNKGFKDYVSALERLEAQEPIKGLVVGHCQPETTSGHPGIEFLGPLKSADALRDFYNTIDVLVVPSVSESFGKVSVEAQCCGTPVVCYNSGGLPETVMAGVTGHVAASNTPASLSEAIEAVLSWETSNARFTNPSVQQFLSQFDGETIALKYQHLYRQLHQASQ
jgi:glycosyltransferase involved in cell wall biosynthesis